MNHVLLTPRDDLVASVFARVEQRRAASTHGGGSALQAGALDAFEAALAEKMQELREISNSAVRSGWDAVQVAVQSFSASVESTAANFGKRAQEFRRRVMDIIRDIIGETFDFMLSAMRSELVVGGRTYTMASLDFEQKLVFTGSIDISLTSLFKLLGSGELVVKGKYALPGAASAAGTP